MAAPVAADCEQARSGCSMTKMACCWLRVSWLMAATATSGSFLLWSSWLQAVRGQQRRRRAVAAIASAVAGPLAAGCGRVRAGSAAAMVDGCWLRAACCAVRPGRFSDSLGWLEVFVWLSSRHAPSDSPLPPHARGRASCAPLEAPVGSTGTGASNGGAAGADGSSSQAFAALRA